MVSKELFFNEKIKSGEEKKKTLDKKINHLIKIRHSLAIASVAVLFFIYGLEFTKILGWFCIGTFGVSFCIAVSLQKKAKSKLLYILSEMNLWKTEAKLLTRNFSETFDGSTHRDESHFYSSDLDLFGSYSLF